MKPHEIEKAISTLRAIKHATDTVEVLSNRRVVQITLDGDIALTRHRSGTGWAASIGFPDDLSEAMTITLHKWAVTKLAEAKKAAVEAGVDLSDELEGVQASIVSPMTWPDITMDMSQFVVIDYTNWKGHRRKRPVRPVAFVFGVNEKYHPRKQWLMEAVDLEDNHTEVSETDAKPSTKMFAMANIHGWEPYLGRRS